MNIRGLQAGQINSARFPSNWQSEMRITRTIPLDKVFGGRSALDISLDVTNVLNYTEAILFYPATRSPDFDGNSLNRQPGEFVFTTYFKDGDIYNKASLSFEQYDRYGRRKYQSLSDFNSDGRVTAEERFRAYQNYVGLQVARRVNYQTPRTVFLAVAFRF